MHYYTSDELPVMSKLAQAFGVSDRWFAPAPCQTWPNRFFAHTGTANGYVNNSPTHFPYMMETVFNRLEEDAKVAWRVYFHDVPQSTTLTRLWGDAATHFRLFNDDFIRDAASGKLPAYSFIEPRYFADPVLKKMPNDQHPPHDVSYGESLIAAVYNAVRGGPGWKKTLLVITYDEHGGCYDHVIPPAAVPPGGASPDGFDFDSYGVRVPVVLVSPWIPPKSIIRPPGPTPFDHTSIIATLRKRFPFAPLTPRDAAAPDLLTAVTALNGNGSNDGPAFIVAPEPVPDPTQLAAAAARKPNGMQQGLAIAALMLPADGADVYSHADRLANVPDTSPDHTSVGAAVGDIFAHLKASLGAINNRGRRSATNHVTITNSNDREERGFQFYDVNEQQKRAFIDAFNGFSEYADIKGYGVTVLLDATLPGKVGLKITVNDTGVTVSPNHVRQDVDEYIHKMADGDDLADLPMVGDPLEHARLVSAIKMRFAFLRHQASLDATTAEAYRAILANVSARNLEAISYHPAPVVPNFNVRIHNDGGRSMSGTNTATNSPGAAVGEGNRAGIKDSVVTIGATASERSAQVNAISQLIGHISASGLDPEPKADAVRNLNNVREEVDEAEVPDKGRIAKWLDRARSIMSLGAAGGELLEKANGVFKLFGYN
jgi:phospholipase C